MRLQELRNNRETIIKTITEYYGSENVKVVMNEMVKWLGYNKISSTDVISYISEVVELSGIFDEVIDFNDGARMAEINRKNMLNNLPSSMRR